MIRAFLLLTSICIIGMTGSAFAQPAPLLPTEAEAEALLEAWRPARTAPEPSPQTTAKPVPASVRASHSAAFRLYQAFGKSLAGKNTLLSPFSIQAALTLFSTGAKGQSKQEIAQFLGLPEQDGAALTELAQLQQRLQNTPEATLTIANGFYLQKGYRFAEHFLAQAKIIGTTLHSTDFRQPERAAESINAWAQGHTANKIPKIITPDNIAPDTKFALLNAVYFKGKWESPFEKESTKEQDFTRENGTTVAAPMMHQSGRWYYHEFPEGKLVILPYKGGQLAMVAVLPTSKLATLESRLSQQPELFSQWLAAAQVERVVLRLPKFTTGSFADLIPQLKALGVHSAFSPESDLSGIGGPSCHENPAQCLQANAVLHRTWMQVDESGTEAAAVTAITGLATASPIAPPPPKEFFANRPFLFAVMEYNQQQQQAGHILFLGRMHQPE
jgi:serpin B